MKISGSKILPLKIPPFSSFLPKPLTTFSARSTRLFTDAGTHFTSNHSLRSSITNARYRNTLSLFTHYKTTQDLKALKSSLIVQGLITLETFIKEFVKRCYYLGAYDLALSTSKLVGTRPRILLQYLMLKWLCNDGLFEDVLMFFGKSRIFGCSSDNYTFPIVLKACAASNDVSLGRIIHGVVLRNGYSDNVVIQTALLGLYSRIGRIWTARLMLDRMPEPDLVAWNVSISGCCMSGFDEEVLELFLEVFVVGLKPNVSTLASVIPVCSRLGFLNVGKSLHGFAIKSGFHMDESLIPCLISMYASCGDLLVARNIFDSFHDKNIAI